MLHSDFRKVFEIKKLPADISFDALRKLYGNKVKKVVAQKAYKKLKEPDIIKCFIHIPKYKMRIARTKEVQAHLSTSIKNILKMRNDFKTFLRNCFDI